MTTTATTATPTGARASAQSIDVAQQQHIVLHDISWGFYERLLEEIGESAIRVTFDEGSIEIMPPLQEHERPSRAIASLLSIMVVELDLPMSAYGSSTFRVKEKQKGLEPDECFYLANEQRVRGMKEFDPSVHPPPDLAIEVDITRRSIPRQPIYAALGVPELWRYAGGRIHVLGLTSERTYEETSSSAAFPFLPMREFAGFVNRMDSEPQTAVLREFREWVRTLPRR